MKQNTIIQQTAPTLYVEANGTRYAYRRFGTPSAVPLVFLQHFVGNMDDWDPAITNEIAKTREVILFNNKGVASTNGETPDNVAEMTADAVSFIRALKLDKVDLLGYSLGGFIAQQMATGYPELVRKVLLVGTAPQGTFSSFLDFVEEMKKRQGPEMFLFTFFTLPMPAGPKVSRACKEYMRPTTETMLSSAIRPHRHKPSPCTAGEPCSLP
ncbi:alpha/beta fold hydrolase [Dyadobacter jiangsuensis]